MSWLFGWLYLSPKDQQFLIPHVADRTAIHGARVMHRGLWACDSAVKASRGFGSRLEPIDSPAEDTR